ncbi:hypothetical protein SASPL_144771 [Salvia splendens]|uniref:Serine aminopeptidase S33 domain-containing protein n=1 Tax=Salvia splendens TaxID=180675 RepID=A0A8X8WGF2_SALSN|nr:hypothetical protein SASPL_144771 [Salvia splendens]
MPSDLIEDKLNSTVHMCLLASSVPKADYNPDQYLWEKEFTLAGRKYKREDVEASGVSAYLGIGFFPHYQLRTNMNLVVFEDKMVGCRADANEAAVVLLPSNITVFTLDFSGSGLSDGDYVSLGWHEVVISYLRSNEKVSRIGLWGRSMGAVTSLLYGAEDPSIAGMVLDSAFSNLFNLMLELADVYKIRLPKFTVKMGLQYMRRVIQKKAKFDITRLDCIQVAPKTFIPALFGHAKDDKFIQPQHSDAIFNLYAGDKNIIKFDGDHNSSRPQFYYDSVSIFFYNVLHPPPPPSSYSTKIEKYYDLGDVKGGTGVEEVAPALYALCSVIVYNLNILYEIIAGLQNVSADAPSSSAVPHSLSSTKSVGELLSDIAPVCNDALASEEAELKILSGSCTPPQEDKQTGQNEECCSYTSSNRESWGRCSFLGSDDLPSMETSISNSDQVSFHTSLCIFTAPKMLALLSCVFAISPVSLSSFEFLVLVKPLKLV